MGELHVTLKYTNVSKIKETKVIKNVCFQYETDVNIISGSSEYMLQNLKLISSLLSGNPQLSSDVSRILPCYMLSAQDKTRLFHSQWKALPPSSISPFKRITACFTYKPPKVCLDQSGERHTEMV